MTARRWVLAGLLGGALLAVLGATDPGGVRFGLAVVGCLLLPGLGWARKMRFGDRGDTAALAVVLSICATTAVGTAMAVGGAWSLGWGLAVLGLVAAAGFVPARALVDRAQAAVQRRIAGFGDDGGAWAEWYVQSAQQALRRRRRAEAAAEAAADVWGDWFADVERRTAEEQARSVDAAQWSEAEWAGWQERSSGRRTPGR